MKVILTDLEFYFDYEYMCKSTEICDKTRNMVSKIFFQAHLPDLVFSLCVVYNRNSRLYSVHRMVYFF